MKRTSDVGPGTSSSYCDADSDFDEPKSEVRRPISVSSNHNRDDAGAGLSGIEIGTDGLLHGELAALIAAKPDG